MLAHQTQHILEICFTILILLMYNQRFIDFFILKIHCSVLLCILIVAINNKLHIFNLLNYKKNNKIIHYIVKNQQILGLVTKH